MPGATTGADGSIAAQTASETLQCSVADPRGGGRGGVRPRAGATRQRDARRHRARPARRAASSTATYGSHHARVGPTSAGWPSSAQRGSLARCLSLASARKSGASRGS